MMNLTKSLACAFFDQHPNAVLVVGVDGQVLLGNAAAAWLQRDGRYPDFRELTGLDLPLNPEGGVGAGWNRRVRVRAGDGTMRQVDASLFAADPSVSDMPGFFCVLCDVTSVVDAARGQQEVESRSKVTSDAAPVLIWMADSEMRCEWFNASWLKFRGRTLGDESGDGWTEGLHPEDLETCLGVYEASFEARAPFTLDCRLMRSDGTYRWMLNTGMPRYGRDGEYLGYVGSCIDIHDRKELEEKLAERTRVLRFADKRHEDFLHRLSHEMRNPLAPIANAAGILRRMEQDTPQLTMVREIIERQVGLLRRLVTDLVDVNKITAGKIVLQREIVAIEALIERAVESVREEAGARGQVIDVAPMRAGLSCIGDPDRLAQALGALLDNAVKFSPDGARIEVAVGTSDDMLAISVLDHGSGIAPEVLPKVFELFVQGAPALQGKKGGLGVGLTIAQKVAQLHGGDVTLDSAGVGLGVQATLRVRSIGMTGGSAAAIDATDLRTITGSRVLIIEDNDDARESLRLLVELGGNEVLTASNAAEGLRLAES
jgi:PAS domain S-box-containing protein